MRATRRVVLLRPAEGAPVWLRPRAAPSSSSLSFRFRSFSVRSAPLQSRGTHPPAPGEQPLERRQEEETRPWSEEESQAHTDGEPMEEEEEEFWLEDEQQQDENDGEKKKKEEEDSSIAMDVLGEVGTGVVLSLIP